MTKNRRRLQLPLGLMLLAWLCGLFGFGGLGVPRPATAAEPNVLALFLPGVSFEQLENKLQLASELAEYLTKLEPKRPLTPRVYATLEAFNDDRGAIAIALIEGPLVAERLESYLPFAVSATASGTETRLLVLGNSEVRRPFALKTTRLAHAVGMKNPRPFFDHFFFDGELALSGDQYTGTRDVGSVLSLASLKKADAVLLYEDDVAQGRQAGLSPIYRGAPMPRPTLVLLDRRTAPAEVQRLREAMSQFRGKVHPTIHSFRPTSEAPYAILRARIDRTPRRLPPLLELADERSALPLPRPAQGSVSDVSLQSLAPVLEYP